jgi:hypothetical protein
VRIGIDFDNTIAGFDAVFLELAKQMSLVDAGFFGSKQILRDTIRCQPEGEIKWQKLQGRAYGAGMPWAQLIDGVDRFLQHCQTTGQKVYIISHKTEYGHYDWERINLRRASVDWMTAQGFFQGDRLGLSPEDVYFETTRKEKLERIGSLGCSVFIDDLEEVLLDPDFPKGIKRILYSKSGAPVPKDLVRCTSWNEISQAVFGGRD